MTIEELKDKLSADCSFCVKGADEIFEVSHSDGEIYVEDVASAPEFYSIAVKTVDELLARMEVGGVKLSDCLDRIRFEQR